MSPDSTRDSAVETTAEAAVKQLRDLKPKLAGTRSGPGTSPQARSVVIESARPAVVAAYLAGVTPQEIITISGVSRQTVFNMLPAADEPSSPRGPMRKRCKWPGCEWASRPGLTVERTQAFRTHYRDAHAAEGEGLRS